MTDRSGWTAVDNYFESVLIGSDPILAAALQANRDAGLPAIEVAPNQGTRRFLQALGAGTALDATAIQTVGGKGWDGFAIAIVG